MVDLTKQDIAIFKQTIATGNLNYFTSNYFKLPYSGTRYYESDGDQYEALYEAWMKLGQPEKALNVIMDDHPVTLSVLYEPDIVFLNHHGYILSEWAMDMIASGKQITVISGGTGCGKTSARAIIGLARCALMEGYDFLNVAPTSSQASDILTDVIKWVTGSPFERFIVRSRTGDLFKQRPFPTLTIQVGNAPSTFSCMTVGRHGDYILGKEKDEIHVDEAGLLEGIGEAIPRLITRLRGTRRTGVPRSGFIGFSSNPHDNPSFDRLIQRAKDNSKDPDSKYYFASPASSANKAISKQQLDLQMEMLDASQQARWLDGSHAGLGDARLISKAMIEGCHDGNLDTLMEELIIDRDPQTFYETRDGMGVIRWELPANEEDIYMVFGDPGTNNASSMENNDVPVVIVLKVTGFPGTPATLVALHWLDGKGKYHTWKRAMLDMIMKYRALAWYDGTSSQSAFAESRDFQGLELSPVSLGGGVKAMSRFIFQLFATDQLFAWPYHEGLYYQARSYRESGVGINKIPDDIIVTFFIAAYVLRQLYHGYLSEKYLRLDPENPDADPEIQEPDGPNWDEILGVENGAPARYARVRGIR